MKGGNRSIRKKTLRVRLRLTETQPTYMYMYNLEARVEQGFADARGIVDNRQANLTPL